MAAEWFCEISGKKFGPLSPQQLRAMVHNGRLTPEHLVRQGRKAPWVPAGRVKGLFPTDEGAVAQGSSDTGELPQAAPARQPPAGPVAAPPRQGESASAADVAAAPWGILAKEDSSPRSAPGTTSVVDARPRRRRRKKDALVVGLLSVVVIGLAAAGVVLALLAKEPRVQVVSEDSAAEVPERPGKAARTKALQWFDASKSAVQHGDMKVRISEVTTGSPRVIQASGRAARTKRDLLLIGVELQNVGAGRKLDYISWGGGRSVSRQVRLTDNSGKAYRQAGLRGAKVDGQLTSAPIGPNEQVRDLLVFEPPAPSADFLLLTLPAAAFGAPGTLHFKIPAEMIRQAEEEEPHEPDATMPGDEAGRPMETGVPEIERGIRELESEEPDIFKDMPELRGEDDPVEDSAPQRDGGFEGAFGNSRPAREADPKSLGPTRNHPPGNP